MAITKYCYSKICNRQLGAESDELFSCPPQTGSSRYRLHDITMIMCSEIINIKIELGSLYHHCTIILSQLKDSQIMFIWTSQHQHEQHLHNRIISCSHEDYFDDNYSCHSPKAERRATAVRVPTRSGFIHYMSSHHLEKALAFFHPYTLMGKFFIPQFFPVLMIIQRL